MGEISNAGPVGIGITTPTSTLTVAGPLSLQEPGSTITAASYPAAVTDSSLIFNGSAANVSVTLPAAGSFPGRILYMSNLSATYTVISAAANVMPQAGGAAATSILPATAGAWAMLQSNGTSWIILASSGGSGGGGSSALSSLTKAVGTNTLTNGSNAQLWNWALGTTGDTAFSVGESAASTVAAELVNISTATNSDTVPLTVTNGGGTNNTYAATFMGGNVGIGTTTPVDPLVVYGAGGSGDAMIL